MKRLQTIIGIAVLAMGLLWALQGAGYVGGSFMTDERRWIYIGAATAIIGLVLIATGFRRR